MIKVENTHTYTRAHDCVKSSGSSENHQNQRKVKKKKIVKRPFPDELVFFYGRGGMLQLVKLAHLIITYSVSPYVVIA